MKLFKKLILASISLLVLLCCVLFSACAETEYVENHRENKSTVGVWQKYSILSIKQYGIPFCYEFKNAEIETEITSEDGSLVVVYEEDIINGWASMPDYINDGSVKQALRKNCPLKTYYYSSFQWAPAVGWEGFPEDGSKIIEDYISFIARRENNIVGFAVFYVCSDGLKGSGEMLTDKEFPKVDGKYQKVSEKTIRGRIQDVIDLHKRTVSK